jgi:hypothetical protein
MATGRSSAGSGNLLLDRSVSLNSPTRAHWRGHWTIMRQTLRWRWPKTESLTAGCSGNLLVQVLWSVIARGTFQAQGIILAGGFVKHPFRRLARLAEKTFGHLPFRILVWGMYAFTKYARLGCPRDHREFAERRTKLDCLAATHRLHLLAGNDPGPVASATRLPVFHISGLIDPIVPWPLVQCWLRKNCPALRATRIVALADHNVLGTGSRQAAAHILNWMKP